MPSYDYRCDECKQSFTVERSMSDDSKQHCVDCGSADANRIWTVFIMNNNGSTTDYGQGTWSPTTSPTTSSSTSSASAVPVSIGSIEGSKSACGSCVSKACGTCH